MKETLLSLFYTQVKLTPANVAIVEGAQELTYTDLNERATNFSKQLLRQKITSKFIAVLLPQGQEFLASNLAIFRVGRVCVPLSIDYPLTKLEFMLQDLGNPLLITKATILSIIGLSYTSTVLIEEVEAGCCRDDFDFVPTSEPLAFAFYTSGSTGIPKAVLTEHRSYISFTNWAIDYFKVTCQDRSLLFLNPAFSLTITEIWPVLFRGGTLIVPSPELRYDIPKLRSFVIEEGVTLISMVSSSTESFFSTEPSQFHNSALRWLFCAGEKLKLRPQANLPFSVCYCYGNTETLGVTYTKVTGEGKSVIPVGRPFPRVGVEIFDENMEAVSEGSTGEIYVSGSFIANGYLNRPELNSKKFIEIGGLRYYRTGDLGNWLPDGNLVVVDRMDNQVKINGYRFELGELEEALAQHERVEKAVAVSHKDRDGAVTIIVFYRCAAEYTSSEELSEFLSIRQNPALCLSKFNHPSV
jgi:surfactin family lipopeptide synthetase A